MKTWNYDCDHGADTWTGHSVDGQYFEKVFSGADRRSVRKKAIMKMNSPTIEKWRAVFNYNLHMDKKLKYKEIGIV